MKVFKTRSGVVVHNDKAYVRLDTPWDVLINRPSLFDALLNDLRGKSTTPIAPRDTDLLAPIGTQEVWAAGVTYLRSKVARMEESKEAGGGSFYDQVYEAERPELFFKATPQRVVGQGGAVHIRKDSTWSVPEPELTLFINSQGSIQGYTIGNDMSSRSIEGENPLYLPQAKTFDGCAALGPCLYVPDQPISSETKIAMEIYRMGKLMYHDTVAISKMKRQHTELAGFLFRECTFPSGCFLMTGTCLVPPNDFTLEVGDQIDIHIDSIGTLSNVVGTKDSK